MTQSAKSAKNKTPMQLAMSKIKSAYIAAFIVAGVNFIFAVLAMTVGGAFFQGITVFLFLDVALIASMAVIIMKLKSRAAAIVLLTHYVFSQLVQRIGDPDAFRFNALFLPFIIAGLYFNGISGTFSYHKIREQEKAQNAPEAPDMHEDNWM